MLGFIGPSSFILSMHVLVLHRCLICVDGFLHLQELEKINRNPLFFLIHAAFELLHQWFHLNTTSPPHRSHLNKICHCLVLEYVGGKEAEKRLVMKESKYNDGIQRIQIFHVIWSSPTLLLASTLRARFLFDGIGRHGLLMPSSYAPSDCWD